MEEFHAEGKSPFVADTGLGVSRNGENREPKQETSSDDDELFTECPIEGCLERITLAELEDHVDFHAIEEHEESSTPTPTATDGAPGPDTNRDYRSPYSHREDAPRHTRRHGSGRTRSPKRHESTVEAWKRIFNRPQVRKSHEPEGKSADGHAPRRRLGKSELGKHAYEDKMPDWLVSLLKKGKYISTEGIVPVLAGLLEQSSSTEYAYLCHPAVQHISKLRREGGFCGYRNIQMISSYVVGAHADGAEKLGGGIPSIFQIQDFIEDAWDMGINASGRVETGGVKGTRKYIGTPEAQAVFLSLQIPCEAQGFKSPREGVAEALLFASVQRYFEGASFDPHDKVRCTDLPPVYFQHRGHSLTIVGLERRVSGALELLVFDPMFHDPAGITRLVGLVGRRGNSDSTAGGDGVGGGAAKEHRGPLHRNPDGALKLYRRGNKYLKKYNEFEILRLKT
ncbi:DUF1671-domain-containing protein [Xylariaceae sp. FL1651]|nr:DUF1671-domain-containing protein [Xylariaceae sp. FL1651]